MAKCVFDYGGDMCYAVTEKNCRGCRFRKSKEELQEGRDKAVERLISLDKDTLKKIKRKYYSDRRHAYERA